MKTTVALAAVVLMGSSLAACGNNNDTSSTGTTSGYCDKLQAVKSQVKALGNITQADFDDLTSKIGDIQAAAPADVADDWKTLGTYLDQFNTLLKGAGISMDDLKSMQSGQLPPGVSESDISKLASKLSALDKAGSLETANKAITASAKKDCNIDLDSGGSSAPDTDTPSS